MPEGEVVIKSRDFSRADNCITAVRCNYGWEQLAGKGIDGDQGSGKAYEKADQKLVMQSPCLDC